jgi:hypothetical protein
MRELEQRQKQFRYSLKILIYGSLIIIFTPIVWLPIGPKGIEYFSPNVPNDAYILGGYILGKDWKDWGYITIFQGSIIITYCILTIHTLIMSTQEKILITPLLINLGLLTIFPFWLSLYTQGVINNSDYADLQVYLHIGAVVYFILVYFNFKSVILSFNLRKNRKKLKAIS